MTTKTNMDQTTLRYQHQQEELQKEWLAKGAEYFAAMVSNQALLATSIRDDMTVLLKRAQAIELAKHAHEVNHTG